MVDVPCGFDRLGAMIKCLIFVIIRNSHSSMVYATTGNLIENFSQVRSMRPVICIYSLSVMVQCGNQYSLLNTRIVYVFLSVFVLISYILRVGRKSRKCHLVLIGQTRYMIRVTCNL